MAENVKLYRAVISFIGSSMIFNDLRNKITFVWSIVVLLLSQKIHLSQWLLHRESDTLASSQERQLSRWLHNKKIKPSEVYRNLAIGTLTEWSENRIELALDTSMLWNRFVIIRVSSIYRGRAIPLAWTVLLHSSATVSFEQYEGVLREAARLLPTTCAVTLLADRGFVHVKLMQLCVELRWEFTIRAKSVIEVFRAFKPKCKMGSLIPPKGQIHLIHCVQVLGCRFGPVHLALGNVRTPNGYEQWALISDRPTSLDTFDEYGRRFDIEENFLDDKSAGFQLESSQIDDADALSRLCLILAVATLYLVSTGTAVVATAQRRFVDTHWQRGLSYFQIGWRYIRRALHRNDSLLTFPWLDPEPDPYPVFASKSQASTSPFSFSAIYLLE